MKRADLQALARELAPLVLAEIAKLATRSAGPEFYSTRRGEGPQGWPHESWRTTAPTIPGAYTPGRWTIVPRASFEAWVASRSIAPTTAPTAAANDAPWDPSSVLDELGLRRAGGSK